MSYFMSPVLWSQNTSFRERTQIVQYSFSLRLLRSSAILMKHTELVAIGFFVYKF